MVNGESSCWTEDDYARILAFSEQHLWLFVQQNASVHRPKHVVSNLTQLDRRSVQLLQNIHFLLSAPVQLCVKEHSPRLLRRLAQSSNPTTTEIKGSMRGSVDWSQTLKQRFARGNNDPTLFVTRLPVKTYDVSETQGLKFLLVQIHRLSMEILKGAHVINTEIVSIEESRKWKDNILNLSRMSQALLKHSCLKGVSLPGKVDDSMLQSIRCSRNRYFRSVYDSLALYRRLLIQGQQEALHECFANGILKPINHDTLYEMYVLFATLSNLEGNGWQRESVRLIGYGNGAVAHFRNGDKALRLFYQSLPPRFAKHSLYTKLMRNYNIDVNLRRPDILLEFTDASMSEHYVLVEVKLTQDKLYILESVYKGLAYLKDFEGNFEAKPKPNVLLVVWNGIEGTPSLDDDLVVLNHKNYSTFLDTLS